MAFKDEKRAYDYVNEYQKKTYDRITILAPKGTKDDIKRISEVRQQSTTQFVLDCIKKELERIKE